MGRSNPRNCGVKIEIGRNSKNKPIYRYLYRPSDRIQFLKLAKFGVDDIDNRPYKVGEALYEFMNWLTDGKYFGGLHVFRDLDLSFFPSRASCTGVGHTVNCHFHGYGNSSRQFTGKEAARMWVACAKLLRKHDGGKLAAYPDIALRPLPTPAALGSAINYVIKPFKFANWYLNGLKHGCPVEGLNLEFNEIAFDTNEMLCATNAGSVFGNMSQKSRRYYIGKPPPVLLKQHQIKRFLELQAKDEAYGWEYERFHNHLKLVAKKKRDNANP